MQRQASGASPGASEASTVIGEFDEPDSPTYLCVSAIAAFVQALFKPRRIRL